jgi:hypothetical protein
MSIITDNEKSIAAACYPAGKHDNIQYHFFCGDLFFSIRVFRTESLEKHFVWLYEDGKVKELVNSLANIDQSQAAHLDISSVSSRSDTSFTLSVKNSSGYCLIKTHSKTLLSVNFNVEDSFTYLPTQQTEPVTHLPNLSCDIFYNNKQVKGTGYCKRYFGDYPKIWEYRFIHSVLSPFTVWAADAQFGENKYDYFHLLDNNKKRVSSLNEYSSIQNNTVKSVIDDIEYTLVFSIIAAWEISLQSETMNSLLKQYYCEATLRYSGKVKKGLCLHEFCSGSLG